MQILIKIILGLCQSQDFLGPLSKAICMQKHISSRTPLSEYSFVNFSKQQNKTANKYVSLLVIYDHHFQICEYTYTKAEAGSEECLGFSFFKNTFMQPLKSAETRTYPLLLVPLSLF